MTTFRIGDRIKNLRTQGENAGKLGKITDIDEDGIFHVRYDDGNTGNTDKPERYYQLVNTTGYKAGTNKKVSTPSHRTANNFMGEAVNVLKRMTLTDDDRKLIRTGLMTECGLYTEEATAVALQELAARNRERLVEVADAILAERKADKEDAN